jgi:hypothetical protein
MPYQAFFCLRQPLALAGRFWSCLPPASFSARIAGKVPYMGKTAILFKYVGILFLEAFFLDEERDDVAFDFSGSLFN